MNKSDVIRAVAQNSSVTQAKVEEVLEEFFEVVRLAVMHNEDVLLSGFGRFHIKNLKEGNRRNPKTGDPVYSKPRRSLSFKPSSVFRDKISGTKFPDTI